MMPLGAPCGRSCWRKSIWPLPSARPWPRKASLPYFSPFPLWTTRAGFFMRSVPVRGQLVRGGRGGWGPGGRGAAGAPLAPRAGCVGRVGGGERVGQDASRSAGTHAVREEGFPLRVSGERVTSISVSRRQLLPLGGSFYR